MIQNTKNCLRVQQQTMEKNKDYTFNFSRATPQGNYPHYANQQRLPTAPNCQNHNEINNPQVSIVSGSLPLSSSPAAELSTQNQKTIEPKYINSYQEPSHHQYQNSEQIYEANEFRNNERPQIQEEVYKSYPVHEPIGNYPSSRGMPYSQEYDHKLKASQVTAVTHGDNEGYQSHIFDQFLPLISEPERHDMTLQHNTAEKKEQQNTGEHQKQPNFNNQADIMSLLTNYVLTPNAQAQKPQEKDVTQDMLKLLGRFAHQPQSISQSQTGYLLNDTFIEKLIGKSLTTYYSSHEKPSSQPFYENETVINAEDQRFIFKLSFKYEHENLIFNWQCKKIYPREEYGERKYECMNYFVVDVFPTHIILFNDFTVQPFVYSKALEKHCIRTQLRTFISLSDPSKTVTIKYNPSEADTTSIGEHSKYQQPI